MHNKCKLCTGKNLHFEFRNRCSGKKIIEVCETEKYLRMHAESSTTGDTKAGFSYHVFWNTGSGGIIYMYIYIYTNICRVNKCQLHTSRSIHFRFTKGWSSRKCRRVSRPHRDLPCSGRFDNDWNRVIVESSYFIAKFHLECTYLVRTGDSWAIDCWSNSLVFLLFCAHPTRSCEITCVSNKEVTGFGCYGWKYSHGTIYTALFLYISK